MDVRIFVLSAVLLGLLAPAFGATYNQPITSTYAAAMTAGQVVDGSNSQATGAAVLFYDAKSEILTWRITHNVQNPLTADLHGPAAVGENADVIIPFTSAASPITGSQKISDSVALHLINDLTYVIIHTANNPLGEIRGQVTLQTIEGIVKGVANMEAIKNVPPSDSSATGTFTFTFSNITQLMTYSISHTITNATAMHIHGPAPPDENAGVQLVFPSAEKSLKGNFTLTEAQEAQLLNELMYVTVHSADFPNGEIRGQIEIKSIELGVDDDDGGLSGGEIFAIVFFVLVAILLAAGLAYFFYSKRAGTGFSATADTRTPSNYRKGAMGVSLLDDAQAV